MSRQGGKEGAGQLGRYGAVCRSAKKMGRLIGLVGANKTSST